MPKKKKELPAVNVHNQQEMINLGLHPNYRVECDFSKTPKEKAELERLRRRDGRGFYNQKWSPREKPYIPIYGKLIVHFKGSTPKSYNCNQADIIDILARVKKNEAFMYEWNGRKYQLNEKPFWRSRTKSGPSISLRSYTV